MISFLLRGNGPLTEVIDAGRCADGCNMAVTYICTTAYEEGEATTENRAVFYCTEKLKISDPIHLLSPAIESLFPLADIGRLHQVASLL